MRRARVRVRVLSDLRREKQKKTRNAPNARNDLGVYRNIRADIYNCILLVPVALSLYMLM